MTVSPWFYGLSPEFHLRCLRQCFESQYRATVRSIGQRLRRDILLRLRRTSKSTLWRDPRGPSMDHLPRDTPHHGATQCDSPPSRPSLHEGVGRRSHISTGCCNAI